MSPHCTPGPDKRQAKRVTVEARRQLIAVYTFPDEVVQDTLSLNAPPNCLAELVTRASKTLETSEYVCAGLENTAFDATASATAKAPRY